MSQKTATSGSYGRGWFANFQKLISPKQIMKFLRIFIDDAQEDVAKHFLKRRSAKTNPWEQSFNTAWWTEIEFPPGTVRVVFVNKQNIDKRYRVKAYQSSVPTSILPCTIYLAIDGSCQMQNDEYFKLSNWMFYPVEEKACKLVRYELVKDDQISYEKVDPYWPLQ